MARSEEKKRKKDHKKERKKSSREDDYTEKRYRESRRSSDERKDEGSRRDRKDDRKRDRNNHHKDDKKRKRHHRSRGDDSDDDKRDRHSKSRKDRDKKRTSTTLQDLGPPMGQPPSVRLDEEEDYYAYHQHFRVHLFRDEGRPFEDLKDTGEAKVAFRRFVERYNAGKLERVYYEGSTMPPDLLAECTPVRKSWSFQTSKTEEASLRLLQDGVRRNTEYQEPDATLNNSNKSKEEPQCKVCT